MFYMSDLHLRGHFILLYLLDVHFSTFIWLVLSGLFVKFEESEHLYLIFNWDSQHSRLVGH